MKPSAKLVRATIHAILSLSAVAPLSGALAQQPASAAGTAAEPEKLEAIVVTARRREENLQDVPGAVSAISSEQLQIANVRTLEDLTGFAPNIKVNAGRATSSTINAYIRGVGQNDPLWGFEPGVGIYLDDVYMARPQAALLDVYDVERVEILRGPQGTLYGKNTLAGAIRYITRDIVGPDRLNMSLTGGSYGQADAKISGSMGITDNLYVGAAIAYLQRSGYGEVVDNTTARPYNWVGQDVSDKDVLAARGTIAYTWGEDARIQVMGDTVQDNSNAVGGQRLNNVLAPALPSRYDNRTDMPVDYDRFIVNGISATYSQTLSPALAIKVIGAYREGDGRQFIDFEEVNANVFQVPGAYSDHQGSGEVQLNWTSERFTAVGGLFYFDGTASGAFDASLGGLNLTSLTKGSVDTQSIGVYADTSWAATDRLNVNVGLRWSEDDKDATVFVAQYLGKLAPNQTLFDPNNVPAGFTLLSVQSNYTSSRTFSDVSPRLGFDYQLTPEVMGYFTYAQGFKSGGFDMRGNATAFPGTKDGYDSETAQNYEAGIKTTLLDDKLLLNLTVFYTPYKDVQITTQQFQIVNGLPTNVTAVLNAGKQVNQGVELEAVWRPISDLTLSLNVGYLDAEFKEFIVGCSPPQAGCTINAAAFNEPINSPEWTTALTAQYLYPLPVGSLQLYGGYQYRAKTKVANTTVSITDQPAYGVLDLGAAWLSEDARWRLSLDAKNLTDEEYRVAGYDFGSTGALGGVSQIGFYGPPRTFSVTLAYRH